MLSLDSLHLSLSFVPFLPSSFSTQPLSYTGQLERVLSTEGKWRLVMLVKDHQRHHVFAVLIAKCECQITPAAWTELTGHIHAFVHSLTSIIIPTRPFPKVPIAQGRGNPQTDYFSY